MRFHSTNQKNRNLSAEEVLRKGLAPDGGLFMPDFWPKLPKDFLKKIDTLTFKEIAEIVVPKFIGEIPDRDLETIINDALNFSVPLKKIGENLFVLELFHGPTMAFKDFGARFLARTLGYFLKKEKKSLNIIVATSGDTGSAVASGFFKTPGIRVFILYPGGKVSHLQEKQLTTFGYNIIAFKVAGTFDDCQKLAKKVLSDVELNKRMRFSSANSINFGRLLPQSLYYFWAAGQLKKRGIKQAPAIVVPSGNFGNLFAGLMAKKMGLSVFKFIAATNKNNIVPKYLKNGKFLPKKSLRTISNAMDVGNPSNFVRMLEMYENDYKKMAKDIEGFSVSETETKKTIKKTYAKFNYICDPHTAVGLTAALRFQKQHPRCPIVVLSTAHPAKFKEIVEPIIGKRIILPRQLRAVLHKQKHSTNISKNYKALVGQLKKT